MITGLIDTLRKIAGSQSVLTAPPDMAPYLQDWRGKETGAAACVVLPANTSQVSEILKLANRTRCPVFPQGGNTGLCYGAVPSASGTGIVLALGRMNNVRQTDLASNSITVDAGTVLGTVHRAAEDVGRRFPLHLGSEGTAQIGGLIATNAGGTNALRYGVMRDLVYGLEAVLPDGRLLSDLSPLRKNNIGYDLRHLLIGSEGTLGIVTAASLKLHPALRSDAHAWLAFDDPSAAVALLGRLQDRFDTSIIAYELLSLSQVDLVLKHVPGTRVPFGQTPEWTVLIELGRPHDQADLKSELEAFLAENFEAAGIADAVVAQNGRQAADFWHVRHAVSESNKLEGMGLTHDVAVSVSQVPAFLAAAAEILRRMHPRPDPVVTCHLGDGNIHYIAMFPHHVWDAIADKHQTAADVQTAIHDLATGLGGTFSAEHGIGRKLTSELRRLIEPVRYDLLCRIKRAIDPGNILNPGILFGEGLVDESVHVDPEHALEGQI